MTISTSKLTVTKTLIAAGAVAAALFTTLPAQAGRMDAGVSQANNTNIVQVRGGHRRGGNSRHAILSPHEIRYILRNQGIRRISDIDYRPGRDIYVAKGWNRGRLLKVRINPYSGAIIGSRVLAVAERGRGGYRGHGSHRRQGGYYGYRGNGLTFHGPNGSFGFRW
ncbi:MAG: hypothetical protein K8F25_00500 [Fimbriimonadaceae bacterium]|nr:hypothetical protein [Alphaproteobacteria bacterium]